MLLLLEVSHSGLTLILSAAGFSEFGAGAIHFHPLWRSVFAFGSAGGEGVDSFLRALNLTTKFSNPSVLAYPFLNMFAS